MLEKVKFMNEDEVRIHRELCLDCGIKPDIYLYLKTDVDVALERIKEREIGKLILVGIIWKI